MGGTQIIFVGLLCGLLLPVALIDWQEQRIPNWLNLAVAGLGLIYQLVEEPGFATIGAVLVQAALTLALLVVTARAMRWLNKGAYIGWGDLKFLVAVAVWVGLNGSVVVLLAASMLHIAAALAMVPWRGLQKNQLRPFGPMLAAGMLGVVVLTFLQDAVPS
jgi:prepilin signal peptidase PulO-like enzyme (type II secretory pathway)